ncbi:MAG TPA: gliding motility lipoprotein GldH [Bacteroidia bacterium]|nr:gliding motility lipoprotein GldH [Bacteroidia bacterium]
MKQRNLLFSLLISITISSCTKDVVYRNCTTIPNDIWDMNKPLTFDVPVSDTINKYNIFVTVRNADNYDFSNLYLFIDINSPMKVVERDTMECILADANGKWLGSGLGDIWDNKILFKRNVKFRKPGIYEFIITQAMRVDSLPMIMDAGLSIEKSPVNSAQKYN